MERRSLLEAPKPFFEIVWIHAALCVHTNTLATPIPLSVSELDVSDRYLVFSVFHPAERLNMIPSSAPPFFQIHKSHGIGYGMNSVGTAAIKKLGVICGGRGKTRFIRFGRTLSISLGTTLSRSGQ